MAISNTEALTRCIDHREPHVLPQVIGQRVVAGVAEQVAPKA